MQLLPLMIRLALQGCLPCGFECCPRNHLIEEREQKKELLPETRKTTMIHALSLEGMSNAAFPASTCLEVREQSKRLP